MRIKLTALSVFVFMCLAVRPAVADDDCEPTDNVEVTYTYTVLPELCTTSTYQYHCPGGSVITKTTTLCSQLQMVRRTNRVEQASETGEPCPDIVTFDVYFEQIGSSSTESGDLCPPSPGDCCIAYESGWKFEESDVDWEHQRTIVPTTCPNGTQGFYATTVKTSYVNRRVASWITTQSTGACEEPNCGTTWSYGSWQRKVLSVETDVILVCPTFTEDDLPD